MALQPAYLMNCRFESVNMRLLPGSRAKSERLRRVHGRGPGGAGLCARLKTIQAGTEAGPHRSSAGRLSRGRPEGRPYARSQQVIHAT